MNSLQSAYECGKGLASIAPCLKKNGLNVISPRLELGVP